ncbi:MAG: hypothetical protein N2578_04810, partial [Bdellovibrionaceae bacterium]|nr:hypothetical protein [Pseudobdellovibrionaceae bacterium]
LKVEELALILERFLPYYSIYSWFWNPDYHDEADAQAYFSESAQALVESGRHLGVLFERDYHFDDLLALLREYRRLYVSSRSLQASSLMKEETFERVIPVLSSFKNLIFGDSDGLIRRSNWGDLLAIGARIYSNILYRHYFLKDESLFSPRGLSRLQTMGSFTISTLHEMVRVNPRRELPAGAIVNVVMTASKNGFLPEGLKRENVQGVVDVLVSRVLNAPEHRLSGVSSEGVGFSAIERLSWQWTSAMDVQFWLLQLTGGGIAYINPVSLRKTLADKLRDQSLSPEQRKSFGELLTIFSSPVDLVFDDNNRLLIGGGKDLSYRSLTLTNILRVGVRLGLEATADELDRILTYRGVKQVECQNIYNKLAPLFLDIGLMDSLDPEFIGRRFLEGNLFSGRADGDDLLSYVEAVDLGHLIVSGLSLSTRLEPFFVDRCNSQKKLNRNTSIRLDCSRTVLRERMSLDLDNVPAFVEFTKKQEPGVYRFLLDRLFEAAGGDLQRGFILYGDLTDVPHMIQYAEMLFQRYDRNRDGGISLDEARIAFPAFRELFRSVAQKEIENGTIKESELFALFTFILRYGEAPDGLWDGLTRWLPWKNNESRWRREVWADRTRMAQILAFVRKKIDARKKGQGDIASGP